MGDRHNAPRVGLFGGTFNPIHYGHLRAAREVAEALQLDRLYLIPVSQPPHKPPKEIAPASERLEMLRLATVNCPDFVVSEIEVARGGLSYSIDTLQAFQSRLDDAARPKNQNCIWIIGTDAFLEIHTWKSWRTLVRTCAFAVMQRPDAGAGFATHPQKVLADYLQQHFEKPYHYDSRRTRFTCADRPPVCLVKITMFDISATMIRALVRNGRSIQFLVPPAVAHHIQTRGLYQ